MKGKRWVRVELVCDFCGSPDNPNEPTWRLPATTFTLDTAKDLGLDYGSKGDWGACNKCLPLVQAKNRGALVERSLGNFRHMPAFVVKEVRKALWELHDGFFANWSGNVLPNKDEDGDGVIEYVPAPEETTE